MRILISGASGLVGTALSRRLSVLGHEAVGLKRQQGADKTTYDLPEGADALVHLAGESIAEGRWTDAKKKRIRDSRVDLTKELVKKLGALEAPPKVLVAASAIGIYGDSGDALHDEDSAPGTGFLAEVARDWEAAAAEATALGIRVVHLRIGIVLSTEGGALAKMLLPFKLGVGGTLGPGTQWMSWIHIDDLVELLSFAVLQPVSGPLNGVAPQPVTNRTFTKALGRALGRPTVLPVPGFGLRLILGEMADALLLSSTRVDPKRTREAGFSFRFSEIDAALRDLFAPKQSKN